MNPRLMRTSAGLAAPITIAIAVAFGVGAYFFSQHHSGTLVESTRETAVAQGELIREALEHQMLENDRGLIREMVEGFGLRADIERLEILDHRGKVWYSSDSGVVGRILSQNSQACQACHLVPPSERMSSQVVESEEESILRVVVPLENHQACHSCHDPDQRMNGLLILDRDMGGLRAAMDRDLRWMVGGSAALAFLLVGTVAGIVQVLLLRRLHRIETTARLIADGNLDQRVPASGSDIVSWLGREFNTMADSVTGLVREVRHQRGRLETVINSIDDGIVVLDPDRQIVAANASFLERTGHTREEVLGCGCSEVAGGVCSTTDCPTLSCLATGEHQVRICNRLDGDGGVTWEEVHSSPIRGPGGEIVQVVEVWRDISERRGAEARLAESHRLSSLGMLASGFSHELNTPLATVLTCIEAILRETGDKDEDTTNLRGIDESASIARDQVLRCKGITQHFLRLSRGQTSPGEVVELGSVVEAVTRLVAPTAQGEGVTVLSEPIPPGLQVRASEADLQHALINLLLNSIEACDADGTVVVDVEGDTSVHIRVTDNGCGIPHEEMSRIFEPFFSLRPGGTGLGLFLALNFVRVWGGDILVQSTPGSGSTFGITLPRIEDSEAVESIT